MQVNKKQKIESIDIGHRTSVIIVSRKISIGGRIRNAVDEI